MKSAVEQLARYKSVHLDPRNIGTHFIGVPLILWALMLLLASLDFRLGAEGHRLSVAMLLTPVVLLYYFRLHWRLALGMTLVFLPLLLSAEWMTQTPHLIATASGAFVVGWLFQLLGHRYEQAKPAFLEDLSQLLIGPFFLMAEVYFKCGLEQSLAQAITPLALARRQALDKAHRQGLS
ncbi:DUF962 domain-containing protein [Shewanella salipaludis]|uniref:DUF962 domain-containing protein n=1 Tax=Shewanella salipaludis TaxID=2723052 RepID=A0A972JK64_9GAMM|nr:Mpo1-like protein [Shewanella salipaludis]NMH64779.1 DUF962 domain-containing protein [Shewanella salipaludis]